ncbi:acyl-CoA thioesterase [Thermodesulfobacteriota bacterium]
MRRKKGGYFKSSEGALPSLVVGVKRKISFSEVDPMGVVWYGHYTQFLELASEELGRRIGLSYRDYFDANLRAPIVQLHIDYHRPVRLDEEITVTAGLVWTEAARLNIEYTVYNQDGSVAATGYTVQMFTDGLSGESCLTLPPLIEECRERWRNGEFEVLLKA